MKHLILLAIFGSLLSGCSSLGKKDFTCPHPTGVTCMSTRDVYAATNGGANPNQQIKQTQNKSSESTRDPKASKNDSEFQAPVRVTDPVVDTFVTPRLPDRPVPVRTPAVVMRIKVNPYEDAKTGVLYAPGFIFTEIEPRKWTIGKPEVATTKNGKLLKPLEADPSSNDAKQNSQNSQ